MATNAGGSGKKTPRPGRKAASASGDGGPARAGAVSASGTIGAWAELAMPVDLGITAALRPIVNLFTSGRGGAAVVRPDDLLALRIQTIGLRVVGGQPPRLERQTATGTAYLVVHHPPQALAEEVFYEQRPPGVSADEVAQDAPPRTDRPAPTPPGTGNVDPPPVRARAAGESRIVYIWPAGFACDYTLDGLLAAMRTLKMRVPLTAKPRPGRRLVRPWPAFGIAKAGRAAVAGESLTASARWQPAALQSFGLRQTVLLQRGGAAAEATISRRLIDVTTQVPELGAVGGVTGVPLITPKPSLPGSTETAIELPWRLILSPHAGEQWRHALAPVRSGGSSHVELWHTRLLGGGSQPLEVPRPDASRTVRAVWATTGMTGQPMQRDLPTTFSDLPDPGEGDPFLGTLNDYDRQQIAHLSSNFSTSYRPEPIDVNLLMLSALGGWLDCRGEWEPEGIDVESWVHRATMGRDHYVRVVYRGVLFPFGHKAVLIKVSERKFHPGEGNRAYLRQRMFMVVREREKSYVDGAGLKPYGADSDAVKNGFPFTHVRMLTTVTPDLAKPEDCQVTPPGKGQLMFWPSLGSGANLAPFKFRMVGTDLDGNPIQFELPLIFMSNSMASPRKQVGKKLRPLHATEGSKIGAAQCAIWAKNEWMKYVGPPAADAGPADRAVADLKRQRVAFAVSQQPGDTALEVSQLTFGVHVPAQPESGASFEAFKAWTPDLARPMFFPSVLRAKVRVATMAQLTGTDRFNRVAWNDTFLARGFEAPNTGQVFMNIAASNDMAKLDFGKQGDRSGGFVMPNLQPSGLSRTLGPVAGDVQKVVQGGVDPKGFFPPEGIGDLPLPLLFGRIPLSAVIEGIGDLAQDLGKAPQFLSSAATKVEQFFATLIRLYGLVGQLSAQPASLGAAALDVAKGTLLTLKSQANAFGAQGATVKSAIDAAIVPLNQLRTQLTALSGKTFDVANPMAGIDLSSALPGGLLRTRLQALQAAVNAASVVPAGFRQAVNAVVAQLVTACEAIATLANLVSHGKALFDALKALVANEAPGQSLGELITQPDLLSPKLLLVSNRLGAVKADVQALPLLDGAPRQTLVGALDAAEDAFEVAGDVAALLQNLFGDELVVRFDWNPKIKSWGFTASDPLFVVHDDRAFVVAIEARMKKSGGAPKIQVLCSLNRFDLVLIAPAKFIELNFEKIEFKVDSAAKMNVDVLLSDIKFVGPLSFVEVLKDFIPLDGFSDPPYLDITPQGIDAGFDIALPTIACGVLNLSNVSLGAGFTVPFIGQPLSVRFNFCTREQPFHLTVYCFGGGGFFGVTLDPKGVQILEAAFEFGAAISVDFGVASGGVSVMAGIYFRMEADAASLTGYFRLEGHVDVLGLITASLELYLELRYEFETGKAVGIASLTIEIEVLIFSGSVTIRCEKKFAGSNGDPTLRQLLGLATDAAQPLEDELQAIQADTTYGWRSYCEAFA